MIHTMTASIYVYQGTDKLYYDDRIETLLAYTYGDKTSHEDYDKLFHEVLCEYLVPNAPMLAVSKIKPNDGTVLVYLSAIGVDYTITNLHGPQWPGVFSGMPDARYAVSICMSSREDFELEDDEDDPVPIQWSDFGPGRSLNGAALAAVLACARETCRIIASQGTLPLIN